MKQTLITIIVSAIISTVISYCYFNYFPYGEIVDITQDEMIGSTITTILGTDTLTASRTVINNNFTALNNDKIENSTTTLEGVTSIPNLATIGTISSGIWGGTTINVNKGGTGSTTLQQYAVLLGSSTNSVFAVNGLGTAAQVLTSNGVGLPPSWQTLAINRSVTVASSTLIATGGVTGSSTIPIGVSAPDGETWDKITCFTDAGTAQLEFGDGTNWMDYQYLTTATSTDSSLTNNTFYGYEKRYIRVGQTSGINFVTCSAVITEE